MQVTELDNLRSQKGHLQRACGRLEKGGFVAVPTECGYRWLARCDHPKAVPALLQLLELPPERPLSLVGSSLQQMMPVAAEWPEPVLRLAEFYWPGPLGLMVRRNPQWTPPLHDHLTKILVRVPNHPVTQELLKLCPFRVLSIGIRDLAGTPVNQPEQIRERHRWVSQTEHDTEVLTWREPCLQLESTIVDVTSDLPRVLRSGFITSRELRSCLGPRLIFSGDTASPRQFSREFSNMHTILVEGEDPKRVARRLRTLLDTSAGRVALIVSRETGEQAFQPTPANLAYYTTYDLQTDAAALEQSLFETLRHVEQKVRADMLLIEGAPREGSGLAILERMHHYAKEIINTDQPGYSGHAGQSHEEGGASFPSRMLPDPVPLESMDEQSVP